jgi:uncharacterized protein with NRDE domain
MTGEMCLIAVAYRASPRYPLVVAANRDESHERPSAPAAWWHDRPHILGGRDLEAGGTWLAMDRSGRIGAVTNLRDAEKGPARLKRDPGSARPSRGLLVSRYLIGRGSVAEYMAALAPEAPRYAPFNLLLCDSRELCYASNRADERTLGPGVHAFSNALPTEQWPKIARAREGLARVLEGEPTPEALLALLAERASPSEPDPRRAALFQLDPIWGTRSSTAVIVRDDGAARFIERRFDANGHIVGESDYEFDLEDAR